MKNSSVTVSHDLKSNINDSKIRTDSSDNAGYPFFSKLFISQRILKCYYVSRIPLNKHQCI